jgi:2-C-methyl-D-erythritol 4-phosphate cytidylyltransferase
MKSQVAAVIVAAGSGTRMGLGRKKKQYLCLDNRPILTHSIFVFQDSPVIDQIVVVVKEEDIAYCQQEIIKKYNLHKVSQVVAGGKERQDSVYQGLKALSLATEIVLIHDGVRPLVPAKILPEVVQAVRTYQAAVVAVPVKDTIKVVANGFIKGTPERNSLWAVQTPQGFYYPLIMEAYRQAEKTGQKSTDDSKLVEALGKPIKVVVGDYCNLKVTTPEDIDIATALLKRRKKSCQLV